MLFYIHETKFQLHVRLCLLYSSLSHSDAMVSNDGYGDDRTIAVPTIDVISNLHIADRNFPMEMLLAEE